MSCFGEGGGSEGVGGEGGLRSAGARRGGVWAFAGWDAQGRELPYQRLRSEAGLVRPRPLRASAWAGVRACGHDMAGLQANEAVRADTHEAMRADTHAADLRKHGHQIRGNMHVYVSLRGDSEQVSSRPDEVPRCVRGAWGWRTSTRTSEEEDGDGSHVRPRPGKGGPLAWLWKRIKNAFGDG